MTMDNPTHRDRIAAVVGRITPETPRQLAQQVYSRLVEMLFLDGEALNWGRIYMVCKITANC